MVQPASKRLVTEARTILLWAPMTAYAIGQQVISPSSEIVRAIATFTSGAVYNQMDWAFAASGRRGDMFLGVAAALKTPLNSFGVQVTGDSTSTPDTGWFRLLANQVAAAYPVLTHHYRKWNDTTQDFDRPTVISTGAAGRLAMVMATGGTRCGPLFGGDNITGDLDVRVNLKSPTWVSGTQYLASKWMVDTSASWAFSLTGAGNLRLQWSADGLTSTWTGDKSSTAAVPFANNVEGWVRVVLDVDNAAAGNDVKFYTSTDGVAWTQLGTTMTTAGVTSLFASTSRYNLGARGSSSQALVADTRVYEVQIRDGIGGPSVVPYLPDAWEKTINTGFPAFEGAPVLTWVMAGHPGAGIGYDAATTGYLADPARMRKMSPDFNQLAMLFNSSHNEYYLHGNLWVTKYSAWVEAISTGKPVASRIALTQNPRTDAAATAPSLKVRRAEMLAWARRGVGVDVIDTYQGFIDDGRDLATVLLNPDGIHPSDAGYVVEKNYVMAELTGALARIA